MTLAIIGALAPLPHQFIDSLVQSTELVTDLRSFVGTTVPSADSGLTGTAVYVFGTAALGDGGGGLYYWNAGSTAADDGYNTLQPTGLSVGRWLRAPAAAGLATITATGAIAVASQQRTLVWTPSVPAAATLTLPVTPLVGEPHGFKNMLASGAYALTVAANSTTTPAQTIDGEPYVVLANYKDSLSVQYAGGGLWVTL